MAKGFASSRCCMPIGGIFIGGNDLDVTIFLQENSLACVGDVVLLNGSVGFMVGGDGEGGGNLRLEAASVKEGDDWGEWDLSVMCILACSHT